MRHSAIHLPEKPVLTLTGTEAELKLLDRLQRYDLVSSDYLTAGMGYYGPTVLTRLYKAQAAGIPEFAKRWAIKRNVNYPVELRPIGKRLLAMEGRWIGRERGTDHFEHMYYRSTAEFLFDWAATLTPGLTLKTLDDILADPRCPEETRDDPSPHHLPLGGKQFIVPDFFRGYEYQGASMFFHVEVDRNTEPLTTTADRRNIAEKIEHYNRYLEEGGPNTRYGFRTATVLWLTTSHARADGILRVAAKSSQPKRHAVKVLSDFTTGFPPPSDLMVSQPWARAEGGPLDILAILKETSARKHGPAREGREDRGVVEGN